MLLNWFSCYFKERVRCRWAGRVEVLLSSWSLKSIRLQTINKYGAIICTTGQANGCALQWKTPHLRDGKQSFPGFWEPALQEKDNTPPLFHHFYLMVIHRWYIITETQFFWRWYGNYGCNPRGSLNPELLNGRMKNVRHFLFITYLTPGHEGRLSGQGVGCMSIQTFY